MMVVLVLVLVLLLLLGHRSASQHRACRSPRADAGFYLVCMPIVKLACSVPLAFGVHPGYVIVMCHSFRYVAPSVRHHTPHLHR